MKYKEFYQKEVNDVIVNEWMDVTEAFAERLFRERIRHYEEELKRVREAGIEYLYRRDNANHCFLQYTECCERETIVTTMRIELLD